MELFDDIREHVVFAWRDDQLIMSYKIDRHWCDVIVTSEKIENLKSVINGKSEKSNNLLDLGRC